MTTADRLMIDGRLVATVNVGDYPPATVMLFRAVGDDHGWSLLVIRRTERYDDCGDVTAASARVSLTRYHSLPAVRDAVECYWFTQLLEAGHRDDADLHRMWAPEQLLRDLDRSSIYNKDLAMASGYFGSPIPAPGRALAGWQDEACAAMAAHLQADTSCWESHLNKIVWDEPVVVTGTGVPVDADVIGALRIWDARLGLEAVVIVRVDCCGEIFARVADRDEVGLTAPWGAGDLGCDLDEATASYAIRHLSAKELDHASDLWERRRRRAFNPGT